MLTVLKYTVAVWAGLDGEIVAAAKTFFAWLRTLFSTLANDELSALFSTVNAAVPSFDPTAWLGYFDWADYFLPLSEILVMAQAWFVLYLGVFAFRFIKSFVPTVSG